MSKHSSGRVKFWPASRVGVHHNAPYARPYKGLKRGIGIAVFAMAAVAAVLACATVASASPSPAAKACTAFRAWNHTRTTASLNMMLTASERAPWANLGEDISIAYFDVRSGDTFDRGADVKAVAGDCRHQ